MTELNPGPETDIGPAVKQAFIQTDPNLKAQAVKQIYADLADGRYDHATAQDMPLRPGRPERPQLLPPRDVPRRRITSGPAGRIALLHAIAHIELNAIDLALDMVGRVWSYSLPFDFVRDWMSVAHDEARHFSLLQNRLTEMQSHYGALDAHDGLWEAAVRTKDDLAGRLAIAPLVLEARGLDVTPQLITKMSEAGDDASAAILNIIMEEEVSHVATGKRWFDYVCGCDRSDPISHWQSLVRRYFNGSLKPPFNIDARTAARFSAAFYAPLAEEQRH